MNFHRPLLLAASLLFSFQAFAATADPLPAYRKPPGVNKGVLRVFGANLKGLVKAWEEGYMKHNPDVRIADNPGGSDAAIGVLQHGTAEIAVMGRELELNDYLGFSRTRATTRPRSPLPAAPTTRRAPAGRC